LSTKFATMLDEELTIPNGLLVTHATRNLSRLTGEGGVPLWASVTIGYDTPWRQVHELLISAATATANVRKDPAPIVLQDELSDYYVHYTLQVRIEEARLRRLTLSELNSKIQDKFNTARVQIMSPHYRARAIAPVLGQAEP
jgi:small-conductance mechanosensitive channel